MSLKCDFFSLHLRNSIGNFAFYLHNSFTLLTLALGSISLKVQIFSSFDQNIFFICLYHIFSMSVESKCSNVSKVSNRLDNYIKKALFYQGHINKRLRSCPS